MRGTFEIVAFEDDHVAGAAEVLGARHRAHRERQRLLPDVADFRAQVESARADATGVAALQDGEVVGYLLGACREDPLGAHIWSDIAGHAVREAETIPHLYAAAAKSWVESGLSRHYVFVPAVAEMIRPWFRLSFGASGALAVRAVADEEASAAPGPVSVRLGRPGDARRAAQLTRLLQEELTESPSFSGRTVPSEHELIVAWNRMSEDPLLTHFVAERSGKAGLVPEVVGHVVLRRRPADDLRILATSVDLSQMVTEPAVRGLGVGRALTAHALRWARESGYSAMTIDWRMTNLVAARFWPQRGFQETFLRLYRSIP
ncbi:MAG: GNAT family N-acetyltransferase [Acidimicrobiales bacterium]